MSKTYQGACHCGRITFEVVSEEITRDVECNCSLCRQRGALWKRA